MRVATHALSIVFCADGKVPVSVVTGEAGSGKSTLMANVAAKYTKEGKHQILIHFVGTAPQSTRLLNVLMRMWFECEKCAEAGVPNEAAQLLVGIKDVLERAGQKMQNGLLIIFIDALNQLDNTDVDIDLDWLPESLPENVRVVISTLPGKCLAALRKRNHIEIEMTRLKPDTCKEIFTKHLKGYNKKLDDKQLSSVVSKRESNLPLWLTIACEELRVYGEVRKLDDRIATLHDELPGLIEQALKRVIADSVFGDLLQATLSLIRCSKCGLSRDELCELLAMEPALPTNRVTQSVELHHETVGAEISHVTDDTVRITHSARSLFPGQGGVYASTQAVKPVCIYQ
jgi:nephrocystin-3